MTSGLGNISIRAFVSQFANDVVADTDSVTSADGHINAEAIEGADDGNPIEVVKDYFAATADDKVCIKRIVVIAEQRAKQEGERVDQNGDGVIQASEGRWIQPAFAQSYEFVAEQVAPPPQRSVAQLRQAARAIVENEFAARLGHVRGVKIKSVRTKRFHDVIQLENQEPRFERGSLKGFAFSVRGKNRDDGWNLASTIVVAVHRQSGEIEAAFSGRHNFIRGYDFDKEWPGRCRD